MVQYDSPIEIQQAYPAYLLGNFRIIDNSASIAVWFSSSQFANMIDSHRPGYEIEGQIGLRESHLICQSSKDDEVV